MVSDANIMIIRSLFCPHGRLIYTIIVEIPWIFSSLINIMLGNAIQIFMRNMEYLAQKLLSNYTIYKREHYIDTTTIYLQVQTLFLKSTKVWITRICSYVMSLPIKVWMVPILPNIELELTRSKVVCTFVNTVDSCYNVPLGKQEKVRYNEMFLIKRCFY